ncbi:V-type ATPase assembly factor PKR1 [Aspergillus clavatus NRRL 1]|uniref:ER membrane protein (Pkr1), putative n=1 Tax=Aspergillus clavatus (strain ATCC 1007 / CBS 513.65 / DSM 816 / NCTC 3887 / NRRL 1 / QM 1276 / 107) TaxID=344612 RepID=A1CEF1_ASPCL|nr:ER membrane protein (Pkr1), putative [Aspergillus clavatus NRRL 1]EAW11250.1 ER membrane protein (Pkr1), putative [Aspergillus clavatus NRRL 1]
MGSFMEDLWSSIFTPGPTPTLLVATNVTFAALQVLLFALLLATYSIHFVVLSVLSAGLWWSINWFARELSQVQAQQAQGTHEEKDQVRGSTKPPGALDSSESDTETETAAKESIVTPIPATDNAPSPTASSLSTSATLQPPAETRGARKRLSVGGDSSGYQSTDSEWEKVDDSNAS